MSEENTTPETETPAPAPSGGGNKMIIVILLAVIALLLAGIIVLFFTPIGKNLLGHGEPPAKHEKKKDSHEEEEKDEEAEKVDVKELKFTTLPEVLINLRSKDGAHAFLKATFIIETATEPVAQKLDALKPQIIDQFQLYIRELDVDDLRGSAGIQRLRQELKVRVNNIMAPDKIRSVLIKDFILQ